MKWADAVLLLYIVGGVTSTMATEVPDEDELALLELMGELETDDHRGWIDFFQMMEDEVQMEEMQGKENAYENE